MKMIREDLILTTFEASSSHQAFYCYAVTGISLSDVKRHLRVMASLEKGKLCKNKNFYFIKLDDKKIKKDFPLSIQLDARHQFVTNSIVECFKIIGQLG